MTASVELNVTTVLIGDEWLIVGRELPPGGIDVGDRAVSRIAIGFCCDDLIGGRSATGYV